MTILVNLMILLMQVGNCFENAWPKLHKFWFVATHALQGWPGQEQC